MIVFLYRPSPQVPRPSLRAAELCFEASRYNVYMQWNQINTKSIDLTWIFTQSLFMALNTLLWSLSYSEIRKEHPRPEVEQHLHTAQEAIYLASERWPGVESALELYDNLSRACLKAYDGSSEVSYSLGSPSNKASPASSHEVAATSPASTPSTTHSPLPSTHNPTLTGRTPSFSNQSESKPFAQPQVHETSSLSEIILPYSEDSISSHPSVSPQPNALLHKNFDPNSLYNSLPSPLDFYSRLAVTQSSESGAQMEQSFFLGSVVDQHPQYLYPHYMPDQPIQALSLEQQSQLMNILEMDGLSNLEIPHG